MRHQRARTHAAAARGRLGCASEAPRQAKPTKAIRPARTQQPVLYLEPKWLRCWALINIPLFTFCDECISFQFLAILLPRVFPPRAIGKRSGTGPNGLAQSVTSPGHGVRSAAGSLIRAPRSRCPAARSGAPSSAAGSAAPAHKSSPRCCGAQRDAEDSCS